MRQQRIIPRVRIRHESNFSRNAPRAIFNRSPSRREFLPLFRQEPSRAENRDNGTKAGRLTNK
jgi:hypothetical protein